MSCGVVVLVILSGKKRYSVVKWFPFLATWNEKNKERQLRSIDPFFYCLLSIDSLIACIYK